MSALALGAAALPAARAGAADATPVSTIVAGSGQSGQPTAGPATSSALGDISSVAVDSSGNLYLADPNNHVVEKVTPGGDLSIVAGSGQFGAPTPGPATSSRLRNISNVAVSSSGDLYLSDTDNNVIEKVTPGGDLSIVAGTGKSKLAVPGPAKESPIDKPGGLALDSSGNLFVSQPGRCDVLKIDTSGTLSIAAGGACGKPIPGPATSSPLFFPHGLATDPSGNLYIAATGHNLVVKVDTSGTLSIVAGVRDTGQQCM
ncbi:MAG: hypothetical protein WCI50_14280, partial [Actinomycetes bacterium]